MQEPIPDGYCRRSANLSAQRRAATITATIGFVRGMSGRVETSTTEMSELVISACSLSTRAVSEQHWY